MEKTISIEEVFNSDECKKYLKVSKEISKYYKSNATESPELKKKYRNALKAYRQFLSDNGIKFPVPKYPILHGNEKTIKYKATIVKEKEDGTYEYIRMIVNPNWIYFK